MRPLLALALSLSPALAQADDIPGTDYASGNWSGAAETDSAGNFLDCYTMVGYVEGEELWAGLYTDDTITVFLSAPGTSFAPNQTMPAWLMTETGYPVQGQAFAVDQNYVGFTLYGLDDGINFLTQGSYLRLMGVGIDQSFDVRGFGGALAQARACLAVQGQEVMAAAPVPANPGPVTEPGAGAAASPEPGGIPVLGSGGAGSKPIQMSKPLGKAKPVRP